MTVPTGQPGGQDQGQAPPAPTGQQPPPPAAPPAGQQPPPQGSGQAPPEDVASLPAWAQTLIRNTRDEAARERTTARENAAAAARTEVTQQLAQALGITPAGQAPDPVALQAQIVEREDQLKRERVENAAYRVATQHGADPDALLDSRAFLADAHQLDPGAADFTTRLDAAVVAAVTANPKIKAVVAPAGSAPPPAFAPNPAQAAGNGSPPQTSTVQAGRDLYRQMHPGKPSPTA